MFSNKLGLECEGFVGMGWLRELPDFRITPSRPFHQGEAGRYQFAKTPPAYVDLTAWCSPIENQGELGSCTANAGTGLFEYFENKASSTYIDASASSSIRLQESLGLTGDSGAYLRTTAEAMLLFGVPPEKYYPYIISKFDDERLHFLFLCRQLQGSELLSLRSSGNPKAQLLASIKRNLGAGLLPCSALQFTHPSTWRQ